MQVSIRAVLVALGQPFKHHWRKEKFRFSREMEKQKTKPIIRPLANAGPA